jgi:hypothetical protein
MATTTDKEATLDKQLVKKAEAEWRKLSQQGKSTAKGDTACSEEREAWHDADLEVLPLFVALIAVGGTPAAGPAFLALILAIRKSSAARQKYIECLAKRNDPRKTEVEKQLRAATKIESQLIKENDRLKKAAKKK